MNIAKLREAREKLSLTQEYVAKYLGVPRTAIVQIENGNRKISGEELAKLCRLYGVSADYILGNINDLAMTEVFARSFDSLSEIDKQEIINLIQFKKQMKLKEGRIDTK